MASVLSRIQIIMEANAANYNNELRRARNHSRSTFGQISKAAGKMALGVGAALAGMGAASVKTAMSFETAMAEVNKTADFVTEDGLGNLRKELEDLSKTMPLAFEELADIAASGGQMGIAGENLAQFTETIAKMGIAFDISAGQAAESMGFIASAYQVPIEKLGEVGDAINEVSNNSGATADKTIDFMLRTGAAANNMNIAAEATAAMGAAIIDAGGSVEKSGTAVSNMLLEMANPEWLKDNANMFKEMGVSTTDFANLVKTDGLAAFNLFRDGVIAADDPMSNLRDAFGASAPHIAKLFDETSKFAPLIDAVGQGAAGAATHIGSLDNEYRIMADTTANAFVRIMNNARLVAATLGDAFLPAVLEVTNAIIPLVQNVAAWAKENPELIVTIAKVTAVVLGAVVAIASISSVVTAAVGAWTALSTVFGVAKVAIMALSGPIGLTVIALGILVTAGALVYQNWDLIKAKATEIWGAITGYIGGKIAEIKNYFSTNFPAMTAIVSAQIGIIKSVVVGGFNLVKNTVQTVLAVIKAVIAGDFGAIPSIIGQGLKNAVGIVKNMMGSILNVIKETGSKLYQVGADMIQGLINGVKSKAAAAKNAIKDTASSMYQGVKDFFIVRSPSRLMREMGVNIVDGLIVGINDKESDAYKAAVSVANSVLDGIASTRKSIALFGNDSAVAAFDYDVLIGKYDDIAPSLREKYRADLLKLEQMKREEQQRASITTALQGRFSQFGKDKAAAGDSLQGMLGGLEQQSPMGKIQAEYEARNAIIEQYENTHTNMVSTANEARIASDQAYMDAKRNLLLTQGESLFGDMAELAKGFAGEQSGVYKALFAVEKGFAIAQSAMAIQQSIAKAMAVGFPANIPIIGQAVMQGAGIIKDIKSIAMPTGQAHDGIANIPREGTWVLDKNERVVKADDNKKLSQFLDSNEKRGAGVNITINNNSSASVSAKRNADGTVTIDMVDKMIEKSFRRIGRANSLESKSIQRHTTARVKR